MTPGLAIDEIRVKVLGLARTIDAPERDLPTFGASEETGRPSIEARRGRDLAFVIRERGQIYEDWWTSDEDELLYWIFDSVTHSMASTWELRHRVPDQDARKGAVSKQLELLRSLSPAWEQRWRREHARLLKELQLPEGASSDLQQR